MYPFDTSKVYVEYRDDVTKKCPIVGRKYTITHSDETAELFVTVGKCYADDKVSSFHDEVLVTIRRQKGRLEFFGSVIVDNQELKGKEQLRNQIFMSEMPLALKAVRYADCKLFEGCPNLDHIPIKIWFQSKHQEYNQVRNFGTMNDFIVS